MLNFNDILNSWCWAKYILWEHTVAMQMVVFPALLVFFLTCRNKKKRWYFFSQDHISNCLSFHINTHKHSALQHQPLLHKGSILFFFLTYSYIVLSMSYHGKHFWNYLSHRRDLIVMCALCSSAIRLDWRQKVFRTQGWGDDCYRVEKHTHSSYPKMHSPVEAELAHSQFFREIFCWGCKERKLSYTHPYLWAKNLIQGGALRHSKGIWDASFLCLQ